MLLALLYYIVLLLLPGEAIYCMVIHAGTDALFFAVCDYMCICLFDCLHSTRKIA